MAYFKRTIGGTVGLLENVEQQLIGADGKPKALFSENRIGKYLLRIFRELWPNPIENGAVKAGLGFYLSAYGLRINGLTGSWGMTRNITNLITDAGRAAVASRINGSGGAAAFTAIGQGTGATAASAADTTLQTEVKADGTAASGVHALATASVTVSRVTTTVTNDTAQLVGTVSETATIAITESGVFNADTNGTLLCRQTFSAVNVVNGDSLQFTWKVKAA